MSKTIEITPSFKKSYKKVSGYKSFKRDKFTYAIDALANGNALPQQYHDHAMSKTSPKRLQGMRDFHVSPNIVVVYKIDKSSIVLYDIGSHQDLGLTESASCSCELDDDFCEFGYNPYMGCYDFDC